jgi:hypothetical protein
MDDMDKIHIKLELCKDKNSGLAIILHFNPKSPNFYKEKENYSWMPTSKEIKLLSEAFELITTNKNDKLEEENILKFSNKQQSLDNISNDNIKDETTELSALEKTNDKEKLHKIPTEINLFDNKETIEEKINISEFDKIAIDEALERHKKNEGSLSENDKERIIDRILKEKKRRY